jgi:hypothetical protein
LRYLPVCRIAVYDDIGVQFNRTAKDLTSQELPPYRRNITAKLQYGHAAVIVGYNNTDFTWTILNSCETAAKLQLSVAAAVSLLLSSSLNLTQCEISVPDTL